MAQWDSVDLLAKLKRVLARPATDEDKGPADATTDIFLYELLTDGQLYWVTELAAHVPDLAGMYTVEQLATADAGLSYDFSADPLGHYEIREARNTRLLVPGAEWDPAADFIPAGKKIRFPGGRTKQFASGPWARYVKTPTVIAAGTEPVIQPPQARQLVVYHAAGLWASRGGLRDPQPYWDLETRTAFGDPLRGTVGLVGSLKQAAFMAGAAGLPSGQDDWWRHITTGEGYTRTG